MHIHRHRHTQTDTILHFTNLIFGTPHTHKYTQTHAHTQTQIPFLRFALFVYIPKIFGIPQTCTCTDTHTCTHLKNPYTRQEDRKFKEIVTPKPHLSCNKQKSLLETENLRKLLL